MELSHIGGMEVDYWRRSIGALNLAAGTRIPRGREKSSDLSGVCNLSPLNLTACSTPEKIMRIEFGRIIAWIEIWGYKYSMLLTKIVACIGIKNGDGYYMR